MHSIGMLWAMLHKRSWERPVCIECRARWQPSQNQLHSIWFHFFTLHGIQHSISLHGILCIQSGCIWPRCMEYTAFNHNAWNPLHSIGMLWAMLHKIHCIQSRCIGPRCMDSTAYNRDPLRHNAWNPLHSMTMHGIHFVQSGCFGPCCIKSTAFKHAAWNPLH